MNCIRIATLAAAALGAGWATGCSGPTLQGPAVLVYHSTGAKGQRQQAQYGFLIAGVATQPPDRLGWAGDNAASCQDAHCLCNAKGCNRSRVHGGSLSP